MNRGHDSVLQMIFREKLIAILRNVPSEQTDGVVSALIRGGVKILEFTFDHGGEHCIRDNQEKVRQTIRQYGDQVIVGCGTVLSIDEAEAAREAGADLIVSPDTNAAVIRRTRELGMVSMPGALTPSEITSAVNAGADIVKLFPAGELGLGYIKALRAPLAHVPMAAVGGVKPGNVADFLNLGVCGFGVGGNLVSGAAVRTADYAAIEARAKEFTEAIAAWEAAYGNPDH